MIPLELLGFVAGIIILSAHFPQIIKALKTKRTYDISLTLYVMIWIGMLLWCIYGYFHNALAVFVMNIISMINISTMIALKLKYGMRTK